MFFPHINFNNQLISSEIFAKTNYAKGTWNPKYSDLAIQEKHTFFIFNPHNKQITYSNYDLSRDLLVNQNLSFTDKISKWLVEDPCSQVSEEDDDFVNPINRSCNIDSFIDEGSYKLTDSEFLDSNSSFDELQKPIGICDDEQSSLIYKPEQSGQDHTNHNLLADFGEHLSLG